LPCCEAVAVSVLKAFGCRREEVNRGPARALSMEEAGRARREAERRNTIVSDELKRQVLRLRRDIYTSGQRGTWVR
jgi:hypothetical protein